MTEADIVGLPEADTEAEVLGTMHYVLHSLGRELGERYDAHLKATIGPNWVQGLSNIRKQYINRYDAHFVLAEPLRHPDSPTRKCLPEGGAFYNKVDDALVVRNKWSHHEVTPLNLARLKTDIATIHILATAAELKLGALCAAITKRINAIANGTYPPAGTVQPARPSTDIDALLGELAQAKANEEALEAEVAAAQQLLDDAARAGAAKAELESALADVARQLDEALDDKLKLQFVIEALANAESTEDPMAETPVRAVPGHPWPGALPARKLTMMSLHPDLFDAETGTRISQEFGDEAKATIAGWKATVPANATVFMSPLGQAVTYINGSPIYLGSLGESAPVEESTPKAAGFFIPHTYTLRMDGTIEDRESGDTLAGVNPAAHATSERLLELIPTGGRLRVTTTGGVARHRDGAWVVVADVGRDQWFPGHL